MIKSKEHDEQLREILNLISEIIFEINIKFDVTYINQTGIHLFGYLPEEIGKGLNISKFIHPKYIEGFLKNLNKILIGEFIEPSINIFIKKDGTEFWGRTNYRIAHKEDKIIGILITINDITEFKKKEDELKLKSTILDCANDSIFLHDFDGNFFYVNEAAYRLRGYTKEELMAINLHNLDTLEYSSLIGSRIEKLLETGNSVFESAHICKDKSIIPIEVNARFIEFGGKRYILSVSRDISQWKKAENALKESEQKYRMLIENLNEGIWVIDKNSYTTFVNPRVSEILGYTEQEMKGRHLFTFMNEQSIEKCKYYLERRYQGIKEYHEFEFLRKDGSRISTFLATSAIFDERGNYNGAMAGIIDITKHKEVEEKLKNSERKLRNLMENIPIGLAIITDSEKFSDINSSWLKIFGYNSKIELLQKSISLLFNDTKDVIKFNKLLPKTNLLKDLEIRFRRKNGSVFWGSLSSIVYSADDNQVQYLIIIDDIEERKQAEEKLKKQLIRFNLEDGHIYMVKEPSPTISLTAFLDILKVGYEGLIISRTPEETFRKYINKKFKFLWLAEMESANYMPPDLKIIEGQIAKSSIKNVILFDRLDYLIFKNGFNETYSFIQKLREIAYINGVIIILSIDPLLLDELELRKFEKETEELKTQRPENLSEELYEILKVVYDQNKLGIKPTYAEIGLALKLSKPTVRKRIKAIISNGYLREFLNGNKKNVELTEKGWSYFF